MRRELQRIESPVNIVSGNIPIPFDNTPVLNDQGFCVLAMYIQAERAENLINIDFHCIVTCKANSQKFTVACFRDNDSQAMKSSFLICNDIDCGGVLSLKHSFIAGTTEKILITFRVGGETDDLVTVGGYDSKPILDNSASGLCVLIEES